MLPTTPICYDIMDFDDIFLTNIPSFEDQAQGDEDDEGNKGEEDRGGESIRSMTSSIDQIKELFLTKKLKHNATERDRRKKINCLYAVLRALLPPSVHPQNKKPSGAATVDLVLNYIPQVQKEVEDLISQKQELLSRTSSLQREINAQGKKGKKYKNKNNDYKEKSQQSIFVDKLSEREMIIMISTSEKTTSLPHEVLVLLENKGLAINHVSSLQFFGQRTFYNIHLSMEGTTTMKYERLDEELASIAY